MVLAIILEDPPTRRPHLLESIFQNFRQVSLPNYRRPCYAEEIPGTWIFLKYETRGLRDEGINALKSFRPAGSMIIQQRRSIQMDDISSCHAHNIMQRLRLSIRATSQLEWNSWTLFICSSQALPISRSNQLAQLQPARSHIYTMHVCQRGCNKPHHNAFRWPCVSGFIHF